MRAAANAAAGRISPLAHAVAPRVYALAGIAAALLLALHKLLTSALPTVRCVGGEAEGRGGGGWRGEAAASATRACPSIQHASLTPAVPPHPLSVHPHSQKGAARRPTRSTAAKKSPSRPKRNGENRGGEEGQGFEKKNGPRPHRLSTHSQAPPPPPLLTEPVRLGPVFADSHRSHCFVRAFLERKECVCVCPFFKFSGPFFPRGPTGRAHTHNPRREE